MRNFNRFRWAYTLTEVTVVIAIMGIVFATAQPKVVSYLENERARSLTRKLRLDLSLARSEAIKTRTPKKVTFDPDGKYYEVVGLSKVATPDGTHDTYRVDLVGKDGFAAEIVGVDFEGNTDLTFDEFGQPDATGGVVIGCGQSRQMVVVDPSGEVLTTKNDDLIIELLGGGGINFDPIGGPLIQF